MQDKSIKEEQVTVKPSLLQKNKIILSRTPIVKPTRSKFKSIFYKANSKN